MKKSVISSLIVSAMLLFSVCVSSFQYVSAVLPEEGDWDYGKKYTIVNPYENVDWASVNHVKSALHTHTSNSGIVWNDSGLTAPDPFIKAYETAGFGALVLTDHDYVGYPWTGGGTPPSNVNASGNSALLTVPGNELSKNAHQLSYGTMYKDRFNEVNLQNQSDTEGYDKNIENVANAGNVITGGTGGILYLAHPRRNNPNETVKDDGITRPFSDLWWTDKIERYPNVKGIEVLNCGQFSVNHSERLWDSMLQKTMPDRAIWGTASDDNHGSTSTAATSNLGTGYTMALLSDEEKTNLGWYNALDKGVTYFSTHMLVNNVGGVNDDNKARPSTPQPKIHSIEVDNSTGAITVVADFASKIDWISGVNEDNTLPNVIKTDLNPGGGNSSAKFTAVLNVESAANINADYVRFRVIGDGGQSHAQPFALKKYYKTLSVGEDDYSIDFANESIIIGSKIKVSADQNYSILLSNGDKVTPGTTLYAKPKSEIPAQPCIEEMIELPWRPDKPNISMSSRSDVMIKLSSISGGEYRIANGEWQNSAEFKNLEPETEYTFELRIKATARSFASQTVSAKYTTKEGAGTSDVEIGCGSSAGDLSSGTLWFFSIVAALFIILLMKKRIISAKIIDKEAKNEKDF